MNKGCKGQTPTKWTTNIFFFRFAEEDVELIQHCFQYTAAVLHSTLAVQNEQRLKKQTQVSSDIVYIFPGYSITHLINETVTNKNFISNFVVVVDTAASCQKLIFTVR